MQLKYKQFPKLRRDRTEFSACCVTSLTYPTPKIILRSLLIHSSLKETAMFCCPYGNGEETPEPGPNKMVLQPLAGHA